MKWLSLYILIAGVLFISICTAVTTMYLTTATETLILNHQAIVVEYSRLEAENAALLRRVMVLEEQVEKLQYQGDLIAAASRMSWGDAYKFMREVEIDR